MRVTRSLILLLGVAMAAAGCARQQVAYVTVPTAAGPSGIDNVVYGLAAPPAPAMVAQPSAGALYAMAPYGTAPYAAAPYGTAPYAAAPYAAAPFAYAPTAAQGPYALDSGDRLRIVVFGQDGLSNSYSVDAGGYIAMPLIGAVPARGATSDELSNRIADKLRQGFVREPHVAVEIEAYRPFFILGEVTAPGQYPYVANMTAETAVAIAGGFAPRAYRKTVILDRSFGGRPMRMAVPLTFPLRPGDTVNVQERWF